MKYLQQSPGWNSLKTKEKKKQKKLGCHYDNVKKLKFGKLLKWELNPGEPTICPPMHPKSTSGTTLTLLLGVTIQKSIHYLRYIHIYTYNFFQIYQVPVTPIPLG